MYAVVKWLEENIVGVVSECWLKTFSGLQGAMYPPSRVLKRVLDREIPGPSWSHYEAKVYAKGIDTYARAYELCGQYCESSDFEQITEGNACQSSTSGSRPQRAETVSAAPQTNKMADSAHTDPCTTSSATVISGSLFLPSSSQPGQRGNTSSSKRGNTLSDSSSAATNMRFKETSSSVLPQYGASSISVERDISHSYPMSASACSQGSLFGMASPYTSYVDLVNSSADGNSSYMQMPIQTPNYQSTPKHSPSKKVLEAIYRKVSLIDEKVMTLNEIISKQFPDLDENERHFHTLQNQADLREFEERLQDADYMKKMVKILTPYCQKTCSKSVTTIMNTLAVRAVWTEFSLRGQRLKKAFDRLAAFKLIKKVVHRTKGFSYAEVEEHLTLYFKRLPSQHRRPTATARVGPLQPRDRHVESNNQPSTSAAYTN